MRRRSTATMVIAILTLLVEAQHELCATAPADGNMSVVTNAIAAMDAIKLNQWAYTLTTILNGEKTIEKHDPSQPRNERWQLVLKDGKTPTEKELTRYATEHRRRRSKRDANNLSGIIDLSKISILSNDTARIYCGIQIKTDAYAKDLKVPPVRGTLVIHQGSSQVERLDVACTERFGKTGVFSINELSVGLAFQQHPGHPGPLPKSVSMRIRGRALIFKSLNLDSQASYSDLEWKGQTTVPASP